MNKYSNIAVHNVKGLDGAILAEFIRSADIFDASRTRMVGGDIPGTGGGTGECGQETDLFVWKSGKSRRAICASVIYMVFRNVRRTKRIMRIQSEK